MIGIEYCPSACWGIDVRDMRKLFETARRKIINANYGDHIKVSTPYEAEAVWLTARCRRLNTKFYIERDDKMVEVDKNDFFRVFASTLREIELLLTDVEAFERGKDECNPVDDWLDN